MNSGFALAFDFRVAVRIREGFGFVEQASSVPLFDVQHC